MTDIVVLNDTNEIGKQQKQEKISNNQDKRNTASNITHTMKDITTKNFMDHLRTLRLTR